MALNAFLTLVGKKQGAIKGSVTQKGREGAIMVIAANHEIMSTVGNTGSGAATGKRVHKPFVITKELDKSSPLLYQAMINTEDLTVWELKFYSAAVTGVEKQTYTVKLTDALITDIRFFLPNTKIPESVKLNPYEEIEFTYQTIQWTWVDGNITTTDQWQP
jgi:type VI secretion system secreted protein Hcp